MVSWPIVSEVVPTVVKIFPRAWSKTPFFAASTAACEAGCVSDDAERDWAVDGDTGFRAAVIGFGFFGAAAVCFGAVTSTLGSSVGAFVAAGGGSGVCAKAFAGPSSSETELERRRMPLR